MLLQVTEIMPFCRFDTVIEAVGVDLDTGDRVLFGGDHRPMYHILEALEAGEEVVAEVPDWAVLSVISAHDWVG